MRSLFLTLISLYNSNPALTLSQIRSMKKILATLLLFTSLHRSSAQVNMYGQIEDAYRTFMLNSHSQFNRALLNDFMGVGGDSRFLSNYWLNGGATNNFNVTISENYLFNYDFLGH